MWQRRGLIYTPEGDRRWWRHSCLQPTPLDLGNRIRVYVGGRDDQGRSSVGYVDVSADNPSEVLAVSAKPALTPGDGFDRDGVVPSAVVRDGDEVRLYYAGYERRDGPERFAVLGGLAVGDGTSFEERRLVMPSTDEERLFRVIHTVQRDHGGGWRVWYGAGSAFLDQGGHTVPSYNIRHARSPDGLMFPRAGEIVLDVGPGEYRLGRPSVVKYGYDWLMFFGASSINEPYRMAAARSVDGDNWERDDSRALPPAAAGWDVRMCAYPGVIVTGGQLVMFYNGDDYGRRGFGWALANSQGLVA